MLVTKKMFNTFKSELTSILTDIKYHVQKNSDNINDLMHETDISVNELEAKMYSIEDDIYELNDMKDNFEYYDLEDINNNKYEIECLQDTVTELEEKNESLEETIDELESELSDMVLIVNTLVEEVKKLKGEK